MNETSKAQRRRWREDESGGLPWKECFRGSGIDVGAGDDPIQLPGCVAFDKQHGDAQFLSRYFAPASQDWIHASQCCEHLPDPRAAIRDWLTLLKPGGFLVVTTPDIGSYENFSYPSKYNPDHRSSWSMIYRGSKFPIHIHIPTFLAEFKDVSEVLLARYVEENFQWSKFPLVDQTWKVEDGVEVWNEFVLRKK